MNLLFIFWMWTTAWYPGAYTHDVDYYDCAKPTDVTTYSYRTACSFPSPGPPKRQEYAVLQVPKFRHRRGNSCSVSETSFLFLCGVWGHLKLLDVPKVTHPVRLTKDQCSQMILNKQWSPPGSSKTYSLKYDTIEYIKYVALGELRYDVSSSKLVCQGVQQRRAIFGADNEEHVVDNVISLVEYRVLIREEEFVVNEKGQVETTTSHLSLPCSEDNNGCETGDSTFIWSPRLDSCTLRHVRNINAREEGNIIIDDENWVLFNKTSNPLAMYPGCSQVGALYETNHDGIYLKRGVLTDHQMMIVTGTTVNLEDEILTSQHYIAYTIEERIGQSNQQIQQQACMYKSERADRAITPLGDGNFAMRKGELVYTFKCVKKQATITPQNICHEDIPIENGYVLADTRIFTKLSAQSSCNQRFPLVVETTKGAFVEITTTVKPRAAPLQYMNVRHPGDVIHMHLNRHSLYTGSEMEMWNQLITFPAYVHATHQSIYYGSCLKDGVCTASPESGSATQYDLDQLITTVETHLDLWTRIRTWIREEGDLLALAVLLIYGLKIFVHVVLIALTVIKHGSTATFGLIVRLYLESFYIYHRVERGVKRQQRQTELIRLTDGIYSHQEETESRMLSDPPVLPARQN